MAISQKLHTKLVQKLILTPSLQQAIKLLPMSTLELADLLNQEMVENPLLEEVPTEELQPAEQQQPEKQEAQPAVEKPDTWDDADYDYFFGDYLDDGYRSRTPSEVKELPPIENTLSSAASLADHLLWQLSLQTEDEGVKEIGKAIIGNLDDDGYLVASVEEIAQMGRVAGRRSREGAPARADVRPDRRRRARFAGVPVAADPATSVLKASPRRKSSPSTCGCCRTTRSPKSRASSACRSRS
jgi:DNA-directed RNA polymerase specialized sigma54-like protein